MSESKNERRRHPRLEPLGEAACAGGEVRCTGIVDIGRGGMRLSFSEAVVPGTRMRMRLRLSADEAPVDVVGLVVWARRSAPYQAGIRFLEVDAAPLERIV